MKSVVLDGSHMPEIDYTVVHVSGTFELSHFLWMCLCVYLHYKWIMFTDFFPAEFGRSYA